MRLRALGICSVVLAVLLEAGWISNACAQRSGNPIATIIMVKGNVQWRENAQSEWQPAVPGQYLYEAEEVRTYQLSRAMIAFAATQAVVRVNESTQLFVQSTEGLAQRNKDRVNMFAGEVYTKVRKDREFEVETPSAVASVRGTEFDVSHFEGWTQLIVVDGVVELLSKLQQIVQEATERTRTLVDEEGNITPPETLSPDEMDDEVGWTGEVEPTWRLKMGAEPGPGRAFWVSIRAIDRTSNLLDTDCNIALTSLTSDKPGVLFSTDEGATWNPLPIVRLSNGQAKVLVKAEYKGRASLHAVGPDCKPGVLDITFIEEAKAIKLIVEFTDDQGNKKQYEIHVEEK